MHIENESVEIMTTSEHEFEEIVEEYKEEILMQEEVLEPPLTDSVDTAPAQGKPRCITLILMITVYMCVCVVHLRYRHFMETTCIYIYLKSLPSVGSSSCYA
jgi:hypothetical protein